MEFGLDNAAFESPDGTGGANAFEIARILRRAADAADVMGRACAGDLFPEDRAKVYDISGNKVGEWRIEA